jgi:hypothetical protein
MLNRTHCLASLGILSVATAAQASVVLLQVEAMENSVNYAPVAFPTGVTSVSGPVGYPGGLAYTRLGPDTAQSGHAGVVASRAYTDPAAAGYGAVNTVNCLDADSYLQSLFNTKTVGQTTYNVVPNYVGRTSGSPNAFTSLGVNVVTNAWVANVGNFNHDAARRMDFQLSREPGVVAVNGAASPLFDSQTNSDVEQPLLWSAFNGVAVRGTQTLTLPSGANLVGKRHADLWTQDAASFATGTVGGYAARLINTAQQNSQADAAQNNVVIRSLLMTGADKTASLQASGTIAWSADTANNLSVQLGAGRADIARSQAVLNAGEKQTYSVSGSVIAAASATHDTKGWAYSSTAAADRALIFHADAAISELTATLNWNFTSKTGTAPGVSNPTIDLTDSGQVWADLGLRLVSLTPDGSGGFSLGTLYSGNGLSSDIVNGSADGADNVEHLFWTGNTLPAGDYAFMVRGDTLNGSATPFGLSYAVTVVPEPTAAMVLLAAASLLIRRRRR